MTLQVFEAYLVGKCHDCGREVQGAAVTIYDGVDVVLHLCPECARQLQQCVGEILAEHEPLMWQPAPVSSGEGRQAGVGGEADGH